MRTVALALSYAHPCGVVHRDIKPGNIMVDESDRVWIVDFGLVHLLEGSSALTVSGMPVGTVSYMSPEQARGDDDAAQPSTDIYSLGATLYELVTGRPPFEGNSFQQTLERVKSAEALPPRRHNSAVPTDIETIILKAIDQEPARRYLSATDFAEDLRRAMEGEPIRGRPATLTYRILRKAGRHRAGVALGIGAILMIAVAIGAWVSASQRAGRLDEERRRESDRFRIEREAAVRMLRETAQVSVQAALQFRRKGQNQEMRRFLPPLEQAYGQAVTRAPSLAEADA